MTRNHPPLLPDEFDWAEILAEVRQSPIPPRRSPYVIAHFMLDKARSKLPNSEHVRFDQSRPALTREIVARLRGDLRTPDQAALDEVMEADRAYFKQFPRHRRRFRWAIPAEVETYLTSWGRKAPPGQRFAVMVTNRPTGPRRRFYPVSEDSDLAEVGTKDRGEGE